MNRVSSPIVTAVLLAVLLLPAVACAPASPQEQIALSRAGYTIELNSWQPVFEEEEAPEDAMAEGEDAMAEGEDAMAEGEDAADDGAGEEMGEEAGEEAMAPEPRPRDILFDLVIYFKGRDSLPGVTVDITQAGADQVEKAHYRHYVETAGIVNGETRQADFVLEDLMVDEGDAFAVEVVPGIPADLGEYREFSETGS